MKRSQIEKFLVQLSEKFTSNDVDGVQACLACPAVIYFGSDMIILKNREGVANFTESYMTGMQTEGLAKARLELNEVSIADDGLITATATASIVDSEGVAVGLGRTTYFLRQVGDSFKVELAEHSRVPLRDDLLHHHLAKLSI